MIGIDSEYLQKYTHYIMALEMFSTHKKLKQGTPAC
jgi:hypothetical protein